MTSKSNSGRDWPTIVLWLATGASIAIALLMLWGAGLFRAEGRFLRLAELENVGSFLSGVFTPLAIFWAARTFVLQRQQMMDTLDAMAKQIELQREALDAQRQQDARERQQLIESSDPVFQVTELGYASGENNYSYTFGINNHGATAQRLEVLVTFTLQSTGLSREFRLSVKHPLQRDKGTDMRVHFPTGEGSSSADYSAVFVIRAERLDGGISETVFRAIGSFAFSQESKSIAMPGLSLKP